MDLSVCLSVWKAANPTENCSRVRISSGYGLVMLTEFEGPGGIRAIDGVSG